MCKFIVLYLIHESCDWDYEDKYIQKFVQEMW